MTALQRRRRSGDLTARQVAERFGVSVRTVKRLVAEPREDYLARASARRAQVIELRNQGLKYAQIAEQLGCTTGIVSGLIRQARNNGELPPVRSEAQEAS